ncbi:MAG: DUF2652 domain-containing protein [Proteobacteria bacterium]|nr:DUF2652 domain-containing protein [Pseudomonadota bacterium]
MANKYHEPQSAFFVIADISGYTKFMSETEITHAKGVLESLFDAIVPAIRAPLSVGGLQGDAVFAYAFESSVMTKQFIMDFAEQLYCNFAQCKEQMVINTGCGCGACTTIDSLDLKIVVHHGECIIQQTDGRDEVAGKDVITAFRLLKNSVKERTGLDAYMLISCDALRKMELMEYFAADEFHTEKIEHIGEVEYVVRDLQQAWEKRRNGGRVFVEPKDDLLIDEWLIPVPVGPDVAFSICTRPDTRGRWYGANLVELFNDNKGKVEPGALYHCHHGKDLFPYEIVDWRPGEYATGRYNLPMGITLYETNEFLPVGEGTLVKVRFARATSPKLAGKLMAGMVNKKVKGYIQPDLQNRTDRLHEICRDWLSEDPTLGDVPAGA